jgi:hypothetical protein
MSSFIHIAGLRIKDGDVIEDLTSLQDSLLSLQIGTPYFPVRLQTPLSVRSVHPLLRNLLYHSVAIVWSSAYRFQSLQ